MRDSLDQFKKIAGLSCQSLSSRAWDLIMESKLKKKEIVKVGGMCVAIKGRKSIAFQLERKSNKDSANLKHYKSQLLAFDLETIDNQEGIKREQPQEKEKEKERRSRKELTQSYPLELISMTDFINSFIPNSIILG